MGELLVGFLRIFQHRSKGPPGPLSENDLDEFGVPRSWRRDPSTDVMYEMLLSESGKHWPRFEQWCESHSVQSFPASADTVLRFLLDPPVKGRDLYDIWLSINNRHEAFYWNEDVDPTYLLRRRFGVNVEPDGAVNVPRDTLREFAL